MSRAARRGVPPPLPPQQQQMYASVPQSPERSGGGRYYTQQYSQDINNMYSPPPPSQRSAPVAARSNVLRKQPPQTGAEETAQGVQTGAIGGGYGPYAYQSSNPRDTPMFRESRFSIAPSEVSSTTNHEKYIPPTTTTVPPYLWDAKDPDLDDPLHNPDPIRDAALDRNFTLFSSRGWMNFALLISLVGGLIFLFAGYPIISFTHRTTLKPPGFNLGGINGSGQVPSFKNFPTLLDPETPSSAQTKVGHDGHTYNLVFSDEFNTDGRSFYPGDDPYWEAVDLHYWATGDLEWYDPRAVTTQGGKMVITMTEAQNHNLNFMSGMVTSWNKFCFTTGIIEVSISLPGDGKTAGWWPAAWTMGNLGRAGYGATTEGLWPYTYDACDVGTYPNQTDPQGNPVAAQTGGLGGQPLSFLPGQRLSQCTCPGSDHPGPSTSVGRNAPEIDIIEAEYDVFRGLPMVSQSYQVAPYNLHYEFNNGSSATTIFNSSITELNSYTGGVYQQAVSAVSVVDSANFGGNGYASYGFEWWSDPKHRDQGYITWTSMDEPSWQITSDSLAGDSVSGISNRLVSEEPHYIIFNLGMSPGFQQQDFKNMKFPSAMYIDYVRVYQKEGSENVGCDPKNYPTANYINNHLNAYMNANLTTWDQAGYTFPRNSKYDGC